MWPFGDKPESAEYMHLHATDDSEHDFELGKLKQCRSPESASRWYGRVIAFVILTLVSLALGFSSGVFAESRGIFRSITTSSTNSPPLSCQNPAIRREWRSLSMDQKHEYLEAVECLRHTPSTLNPNMSLYDDFPFLHNTIGDYAHMAAPFLAWHRYFIHLYEKALKEKCSYTGTLTYWDWSLDWENMPYAPVFSAEHGFGGDSHPDRRPSEEVIIGEDRCVDNGPFAGLEVHWFGKEDFPHCLSRGFHDGSPMPEMGYLIRPEAIEELLRLSDYEKFFLGLEEGPHNAIPSAIGGDFFYTIAPYDPLFFLHHTQLDRTWWRWQQIHPSHQMQYLGPAKHHSNDSASLSDILPMGDFAPGIAVKEVMNTESDLLCYRY